MALLGQDYVGASVDEVLANAGGAALIPEGLYTAVIVEDELRDTKSGQGLFTKFVISQGEYEGTEFTQCLNIVNSNPMAQKIAYEDLARISKAVGLANLPQDTKALHSKPLLIEVVTESAKAYKDKDGMERAGREKSVIKGYKALGSASSAPKSTENKTESAPAETASAGAKTPPWKKK